ncbi:MAG: BON domain-containing protein [Acidobacteriia bacterium]|nr:BON domain-containing protein [Terriglobia bacterium]
MLAARKITLAALLLAGSMLLEGMALADTTSAAYDGAIQAKVAAQLQKKSEFKDIRASVEDGIVTLSGATDSLPHKLDAAKKARKQEHVAGVRDLIAVAGPEVSDSALRQTLARKLAYDRVGYGNVWNVLTVEVGNGVATIGGEVRNPVDRDSAIAEVVNTKGVKGVVENIKVAPTSLFDDQLRIRTARAIYRDPSLSRYGMDPQAPIRIVVNNGHVGLYGVVSSEFDRIVAGIRANEVAGAFSVENHLLTEKSAIDSELLALSF